MPTGPLPHPHLAVAPNRSSPRSPEGRGGGSSFIIPKMSSGDLPVGLVADARTPPPTIERDTGSSFLNTESGASDDRKSSSSPPSLLVPDLPAPVELRGGESSSHLKADRLAEGRTLVLALVPLAARRPPPAGLSSSPPKELCWEQRPGTSISYPYMTTEMQLR